MTTYFVFIFLLVLSFIGGTGVVIVGQKQEKEKYRKSRIKYEVYLIIVYLMFSSALYSHKLFGALCVLIVLGGYYDIIKLQQGITRLAIPAFCLILALYTATCLFFCLFGFSERGIILFTLFIVCTFDAFSQIAGQLFGKRKICPRISPQKTYAGLAGGLSAVLVVSIVLGKSIGWDIQYSLWLGLGIATAAFVGDLSASYVKRCYQTKDFSNLLPGHGGWLDRFDSLIFAGAYVWFVQTICWT